MLVNLALLRILRIPVVLVSAGKMEIEVSALFSRIVIPATVVMDEKAGRRSAQH